MTQQEAARLYALALCLVPEPDAAGDLLLRARNEADLRRRAAAWREAHGMPEQTEAQPPVLTEEQQAHAWHLVRRGRLRRRLMAAVALAGAGALLAALFVLVPPVLPDQQAALANAPEFQLTPETGQPVDGITFEIYKAEATPGQVTLWWGLSGPGAGDLQELQPTLYRHGPHRFEMYSGSIIPPQEREPTTTTVALLRKDRLLAVSTYNAFVYPSDEAHRFTLKGPGERTWMVVATVRHGTATNATVISLNRSVGAIGVSAAIVELHLGKNYTLLRYRMNSNSGMAERLLRLRPLLLVDGNEIPFRGFWRLERGERTAEALYDPIRPDTAQAKVRFGPWQWRYEDYVISLSDTSRVIEWSLSESLAKVDIKVLPELADRFSPVQRIVLYPDMHVPQLGEIFFLDDSGRRYPAKMGLVRPADGSEPRIQFTGHVPDGTKLVRVHVGRQVPVWAPDLVIDLK